ncbi:Hypp8138 [Branchiostoma lanceolatum]|uniref:Hypp8138 protein n=1 Tax=Branchiostoma lanceolatum TaxID=7740 RepID=A0A8J9Z7C7_BRALA|nr:Hypp8138 [Branchiostoma lanceolatum]
MQEAELTSSNYDRYSANGCSSTPTSTRDVNPRGTIMTPPATPVLFVLGEGDAVGFEWGVREAVYERMYNPALNRKGGLHIEDHSTFSLLGQRPPPPKTSTISS